MSALGTLLPGFLCRATPAKAPNRSVWSTLLGKKRLLSAAAVSASYFVYKSGFLERTSDYFFRSKASQRALDLSCSKAGQLFGTFADQKELIEAMNIPYSIKVLIKNKAGEAKTEALHPTKAIEHLGHAKQVAIGDLHASPQKLLETLAVANMIHMPKADMQQLLLHLKQLQEITNSNNPDMHALKANYQDIQALLPKLKWTGGNRQVVLIGDVLADRGPLDTVTLKLIDQLEGTFSSRFIRIASNHDHNVLAAYSNSPHRIHPSVERSMQNARALAKEMGEESQLRAMYQKYLSSSKLMHFDQQKNSVYMHAPLNRSTLSACIEGLRQQGYNVTPYREWGRENMGRCVNELNTAYRQYVHKVMPGALSLNPFSRKENPAQFGESPFWQLIWERSPLSNKQELPFSPEQHGVECMVHGHDSGSKNSPYHLHNQIDDNPDYARIVCLDNLARKGNYISGESPIFAAQD